MWNEPPITQIFLMFFDLKSSNHTAATRNPRSVHCSPHHRKMIHNDTFFLSLTHSGDIRRGTLAPITDIIAFRQICDQEPAIFQLGQNQTCFLLWQNKTMGFWSFLNIKEALCGMRCVINKQGQIVQVMNTLRNDIQQTSTHSKWSRTHFIISSILS